MCQFLNRVRYRNIFVVPIILAAAQSGGAFGQAPDFVPRSYSLPYDDVGVPSHFSVVVPEFRYATDELIHQYAAFATNAPIAGGSPEWNVLETLRRLQSYESEDDAEGLRELYMPDTPSEEVADYVHISRPVADGIQGVRFTGKWLHDGTVWVAFRVIYENGETRPGMHSVERLGDAYLRNSWPNESPGAARNEQLLVISAVMFVSWGLDQGWLQEDNQAPYEYTVPIGDGEQVMSLRFDGTLYPYTDQWRPIGQPVSDEQPDIRQFVESVIGEIKQHDDTAVLRFLCGAITDMDDDDIEDSQEFLASTRDQLLNFGSIKHLFTLDIDNNSVHYILISRSDRIKSIYVGREGEDFCLHGRAPYSDAILRSNAFRSRVLEIWEAQQNN